MGSPKRPRTPRVLATFWASYGPTPPTPIRPKNAQKRALRASSVPRKFRRQNARQLFFLGANIFHKNLPRQLFFLKFFFRVDTDSDSKSKKFSRRLRRRESYVYSQEIFWCFRSRCALARPGRVLALPAFQRCARDRSCSPSQVENAFAISKSDDEEQAKKKEIQRERDMSPRGALVAKPCLAARISGNDETGARSCYQKQRKK